MPGGLGRASECVGGHLEELARLDIRKTDGVPQVGHARIDARLGHLFPHRPFVFPFVQTFDIEPPDLVLAFGKAEIGEGDLELGRPALIVDMRLDPPNSPPVAVRVSVVVAVTVRLDTARGGGESVAGAVVVVWVDIEGDPVGREDIAASAESVDDFLRFRVIAAKTDIEVVAIVDDVELGVFGGRLAALRGQLTCTLRRTRRLPGRIVQPAVYGRGGRVVGYAVSLDHMLSEVAGVGPEGKGGN